MTDNSFEDILTKIISERGIAVLDNPAKCNGLLQDYANGGYKREIRLLLQALEAGYHKLLLDSAEPEITVPMLVKKFHDENGISREVAEGIISVLAKILKDDGKGEEETIQEIIMLEKVAKDGNIRAQYNLGVLLRKLKRFEEAAEWLELAMRNELELHTEFVQRNGEKPLVTHAMTDQSISSSMVLINGGNFIMGSPKSEKGHKNNEYPQHPVAVSSFYMEKYQVTQKEYQELTEMNPSRFKGDMLPVEGVSWYDAIAFCNALSMRENLTPVYTIDKSRCDPDNLSREDGVQWLVIWNRNANGYRLPTEAEWEYACRAGTTTPFSTGNNITTNHANSNGNYPYNNNAKGRYREATTPVGSFEPNVWGLYDMHGNVWEWCWDWYGKYSREGQTNPTGPASGAYRILRGGSGGNYGDSLRSAMRISSTPSKRSYYIGFRLARNNDRQFI
jgi:formylglycine-generating enzyme required for sulfatase activity